ncbi:MAG: type II secretion system F family protein [Steroidobacteraceae bacterium]|jgi:tight adherence protein C|nr:type II secretion system F family protein [Steroidobacteraceae bacterium]
MITNGGPPGGVAWLAAGLALTATVAALLLLGRIAQVAAPRLADARRAVAGTREPLPGWVRLQLPLALAIAAPLGPRLPQLLRQRLHRWLRAAELEEALPAQVFAVVLALHAAAGTLLVLLARDVPLAGVLAGGLVAAWPGVWLRDAIRRREWQILRDLPVYVDMLTLALEAGSALSVALQVATGRMPESPLRRAFSRVQNDLRSGRSRVEALRALGERVDLPPVTSLVAALVQAESSGGSLSAVLRSQSDQRLNERFARAEKLALEAPVKLLAPLILCIFPCTFLVLAFPVALRFLEAP